MALVSRAGCSSGPCMTSLLEDLRRCSVVHDDLSMTAGNSCFAPLGHFHPGAGAALRILKGLNEGEWCQSQEILCFEVYVLPLVFFMFERRQPGSTMSTMLASTKSLCAA